MSDRNNKMTHKQIETVENFEHEEIDYAIIIGARNSHEQFIEHDPSNLIFLTTDLMNRKFIAWPIT